MCSSLCGVGDGGRETNAGTAAGGANSVGVGRRLLPVALVLGTLAADARDLHHLGFYLLVAAVPAAAVSALSSFGDLAVLPGRARGETGARLDALLSALALVLVLLAAGARSRAIDPNVVPTLSGSALAACLGVFFLHALTLLAAGIPLARAEPSRASAAG